MCTAFAQYESTSTVGSRSRLDDWDPIGSHRALTIMYRSPHPDLRRLTCLGLLLAASLIHATSPSWFLDLDGNRLRTLGTERNAATVLVFIQPDCPIANQYAPTLNRLRETYASRQVAFHLVYADKDLTPQEVRKHLKEYRLTSQALLDPRHCLVDLTGATVTPECVVLGPKGDRLYRGRIDTRYVSFGKKRPQPTENDLAEALDAILEGKAVARKETKAIGCYIYRGDDVKSGR